MVDLDDVGALARLDSEDVLGAVERFAEQCRDAWEIGRATPNLPDAAGIDSIVVLGMGGSGVSGDVVQAVYDERVPLPMRTVKHYGPLPGWVGPNTLAFAVSYSGTTEETIAALTEAQRRGARCIAVSSGGTLEEMANSAGQPHVKIPPGLQPRASLGYLTLPLIAALARMEVIPDPTDDVEEASKVLADIAARCHRDRGTSDNPAKDLARQIVGRIPVVYGGPGLGAVAAYRFKCDLNEYGKTPAFWHFLPELDHNEIVGWNQLSDLTTERAAIVLLRDEDDGARVDIRFEVTRALIEGNVADVIEVRSEGTSALARILSLILVTQLAAIYVGLAYGVDPGPVEAILKLKSELKAR
ncbi:MAG: bifunctional phosphoglucose/phosphomannose isomerase [Actinomycetota bacterium]|nr:bifunctional phosphoglucose/phosphomannose isomerase [Actinomycetota bacterium]